MREGPGKQMTRAVSSGRLSPIPSWDSIAPLGRLCNSERDCRRSRQGHCQGKAWGRSSHGFRSWMEELGPWPVPSSREQIERDGRADDFLHVRADDGQLDGQPEQNARHLWEGIVRLET